MTAQLHNLIISLSIPYFFSHSQKKKNYSSDYLLVILLICNKKKKIFYSFPLLRPFPNLSHKESCCLGAALSSSEVNAEAKNSFSFFYFFEELLYISL